MAIRLQFLASLVLLLAAAASSAVGGDVHDMLPSFGLPKGILPDSVQSYSLAEDGKFEVELKSPCYVQFSSLVYYERRVKGRISRGSITDLTGIQVKKLFLWVSVTGIVAHSDKGTVEFEVGFISESLPASEFEMIPVCKSKASCRGVQGFLTDALPLSEV